MKNYSHTHHANTQKLADTDTHIYYYKYNVYRCIQARLHSLRHLSLELTRCEIDMITRSRSLHNRIDITIDENG